MEVMARRLDDVLNSEQILLETLEMITDKPPKFKRYVDLDISKSLTHMLMILTDSFVAFLYNNDELEKEGKQEEKRRDFFCFQSFVCEATCAFTFLASCLLVLRPVPTRRGFMSSITLCGC